MKTPDQTEQRTTPSQENHNFKVQVIDISDFSDWKAFRESINKNVVNLGDEGVNENFNNLLQTAKADSKKIFFLKWTGTRVPRGAFVDGKEISWTQNGIVSTSNGDYIGTYERVLDSNSEQQMLVFLK